MALTEYQRFHLRDVFYTHGSDVLALGAWSKPAQAAEMMAAVEAGYLILDENRSAAESAAAGSRVDCFALTAAGLAALEEPHESA